MEKNMMDINHELVQWAFSHANVLPLATGEGEFLPDMFRSEVAAWTALVGFLGMAHFRAEEELQDFVQQVRKFFIDAEGNFKLERSFLYRSPLFSSQENITLSLEPCAEDVHFECWKKNKNPPIF